MTARDVFTTYYGKRYRAVFVSSSRRKANVVAHSMNLRLREDMDVKEKLVILLEHDGNRHIVFVKCPYDKIVKQVK